jgi:hypothetical protein
MFCSFFVLVLVLVTGIAIDIKRRREAAKLELKELFAGY